LSFVIAPIVEGYGDVSAVRVLLNLIGPQFIVANPVRQGRGKLVQRAGLQHAVNIAAANLDGNGAVLVLFDADDDCAATMAKELQDWLDADFAHILCRVVLVVREFEAWIVGGDPRYGIDDPDTTGNLDGRIKQLYGKYKKTVDQARHISRSDIERLRSNSRSFRKLCKVVDEFVVSDRPSGHG
jgi:hypothetical protein